MKSTAVRTACLFVGFLLNLPTFALAQLHSVEQAESLSKASGRPIFAMAGNKT